VTFGCAFRNWLPEACTTQTAKVKNKKLVRAMVNEYADETGNRKDADRTVDVLRSFPVAFTFICLFVFLSPVVKCIDMGMDPNVRHWMGRAPLVFAFGPLACIVVAHVLHVTKRGVSKYGLIIALTVSSLVLIILGERLSTQASKYYSHFISNDCNTFEGKAALEKSWQAANTFRSNCELQVGDGASGYVGSIEDCQDYAQALNANPDWGYLAHLEKSYQCGGWCYPDYPLWAVSETPLDGCALVAGIAILRSRRSDQP